MNVYRRAPIAFRNEAPEILETAGGMKNVEDLLGDQPFIVYNGDVLCDFSLEPLLERHVQSENEVTLALRSKDGPLQVAMDDSTGRITDVRRYARRRERFTLPFHRDLYREPSLFGAHP